MPARRSTHVSAGRPETRGVYEALAPVYEMLASPRRVSREVDAIEAVVLGIGGGTILDAGCAAGFHAIELARRNFHVTGLDISPAMIREARARAAAASVQIRFMEGDLSTAPRARGAPFDAVLCLGNTMASIGTMSGRIRALRAFRRAMRPGGVLILQMRDLSRIGPDGFSFPTRSCRRGEQEWIFLRRQDPARRGIRFVSTLLYRSAPGADWETRASEQIQLPVTTAEWRDALTRAGLKRIRFATDLRGSPRRKGSAPDLVVFARS